jgi:hypothetical protein
LRLLAVALPSREQRSISSEGWSWAAPVKVVLALPGNLIVDYVKYWGEGHGPSSPANVRDLTRRTIEWFNRNL